MVMQVCAVQVQQLKTDLFHNKAAQGRLRALESAMSKERTAAADRELNLKVSHQECLASCQ